MHPGQAGQARQPTREDAAEGEPKAPALTYRVSRLKKFQIQASPPPHRNSDRSPSRLPLLEIAKNNLRLPADPPRAAHLLVQPVFGKAEALAAST
jgi:hypothetical protein